MIAERVWKTKFWNVHQSSFSIPGMRGREKRKELRAASSLNDSTANSDNAARKAPAEPLPPACTGMSDSDEWLRVQEHVCCACASVCVYVYMSERESGWVYVGECVCVTETRGERRRRRRDGETREVRGERERTRGVHRQQRDEREDGESMRAVSERNDSFHAWDRAL